MFGLSGLGALASQLTIVNISSFNDASGFGIFNVVEGTVNDHLLGIHHVNETVPRDQWVYWDVAFLLWGAGTLVAGWILLRLSRRLVLSG